MSDQTPGLDPKLDPRGLIRESFRIDGISPDECRSIFLDWTLFDDHGTTPAAHIKRLLDHYRALYPDHPMTGILQRAHDAPAAIAKRKGGRRSRVT